MEKDAPSLTLKGFRRGKAPKFALQLAVKNQYKEYFNRKVQERLLADAVEQIQFETNWKLLSRPEVSDVQYDGNGFSCDMTIMRRPDVKVGDFRSFVIPKPHIEKTAEERIAETVQSLRMEKGDNEPFSDTDIVVVGDKVTMDVVCTVAGEERYRQEGTLYTVGEGSIHEKLDDAIVGMVAGEERKFQLPFGETVGDWTVTIHMGLRVIPAPLDDALALQYGLNDLAHLEQQVAGMVTQQMQQEERQQIKQQVLSRLIESTEVDIPNYLKEMEMEMLCKNQNVDVKALSEEDAKYFGDLSLRQIKLAFALDEVMSAVPELQFSDVEIMQHETIQQAAASGQLQGIIAGLKNEAVVEWLIQQVNLVD
jgi:trigger factor